MGARCPYPAYRLWQESRLTARNEKQCWGTAGENGECLFMPFICGQNGSTEVRANQQRHRRALVRNAVAISVVGKWSGGSASEVARTATTTTSLIQ